MHVKGIAGLICNWISWLQIFLYTAAGRGRCGMVGSRNEEGGWVCVFKKAFPLHCFPNIDLNELAIGGDVSPFQTFDFAVPVHTMGACATHDPPGKLICLFALTEQHGHFCVHVLLWYLQACLLKNPIFH